MVPRELLRDKKKIVIKVGTSTVTYPETGNINLEKLEKFVRILINLRNKGKEVIVVSSGAVGIGRQVLGFKKRPEDAAVRQACAAVGQGKLMMIYEKLFAEYGQLTAQILLTKEVLTNGSCRQKAKQTFDELSRMNVVPIVNENDAVSVDEELYGYFGDNDTMSASVASLIGADLLILLSDIEGLYTDDPRKNPQARFVHTVLKIDAEIMGMGKDAKSHVGTGGMMTKIEAAKIATASGTDMVIANGNNIYTINDIMAGKKVGTLFLAQGHTFGEENEVAPGKDIYRRRRKKNGGTHTDTQGGRRNDGAQGKRSVGIHQTADGGTKERCTCTGSRKAVGTQGHDSGSEPKGYGSSAEKRDEGIHAGPSDAE